MTKLTRRVEREAVGLLMGGRPIIVALVPPDAVEVRVKGTRRRYHTTAFSLIFDLAGRRHWRRRRLN